jgi:hypothetical protein
VGCVAVNGHSISAYLLRGGLARKRAVCKKTTPFAR